MTDANSPGLPKGFLTTVQPAWDQSVAGLPGAGIYVRVSVLTSSSSLDRGSVAFVWSGYVRNGVSASPSFPNLPLYGGQALLVQAWALGDFGAQRILVNYQIAEKPGPSGPSIFYEEPGSGSGVLVERDVAPGAAGQDPVPLTIPSHSIVRPVAFAGSLTTDATVADRAPTIVMRTTGLGDFAVASPDATQAASLVRTYSAWRGGTTLRTGAAGAVQSFPMPDVRLRVDQQLVFVTTDLAAGDEWTAAQLVTEEWAVPQ